MNSRTAAKLCFVAVLFGCAHLGHASVNLQSQQQKQCQYKGVWTPSGEWHTGDEYYCLCLNGSWQSCEPVRTVTAEFDTSKLKGKIYTVQGYDTTASKWHAKFDYVDSSLCPSGEMNWHVHAKWSDTIGALSSLDMCGLDLTGNHYDPTYGCGSASEHAGEVCESVRPAAQNGIQSCDLTTDVSSCEIGDLSGKLGRIFLNEEPQTWDDPFATNVRNYLYRSIVLHCCSDAGCGARVACAYLS